MQKTSGYKKVWSVFSNFKTIESREKKRKRERRRKRARAGARASQSLCGFT